MAIIKPSAIISEISGSVGENTFSRNRYGATVRARTPPPQTPSTLRDSAQATITYLSKYWATGLSEGQRQVWRDYADAMLVRGRVGLLRRTAGFHQFVRTNSMYYSIYASIFRTEPPTAASIQPLSFSFYVDEGVPGILFTWYTLTLQGELTTDSMAQISVGKFVSPGQSRYFTPWRIQTYDRWTGYYWDFIGGPIRLPDWCGTTGKLWAEIKIQDAVTGFITNPIRASATF